MIFDTAHARGLADQLVGAELIIYPVRHHSPACAWYLRKLIAECTPSTILVEGPRSFTPLIPLLVHAEAKMPLAVYTYAVQRGSGEGVEKRHAAYYPFCDYSPELVALREAQSRSIPARFIDLDYAEQCQAEAPPDSEESSLLDERHYRRSAHLQALARKLGCRNHEELWEHLFEVDIGAVPWREHQARVVAYCLLSRADCHDEELAADGTLQREAEMLWHIREALSERAPEAGPVLAVVGGFHAVAMPAQLRQAITRPKLSRENVEDEAAALIRYGFDRLDRLNGYSAGMTSPGWHQGLWERLLQHESRSSWSGVRVREQLALDILTDIAIELRSRHGVQLPMPSLCAAYEQALRLSQIRQRPAPVRDDVLDAVISCFVKGDADADGAIVMAVAGRLLCGSRMGTVPPGAHTPPLFKDVAWRLHRQRLKVEDSLPRRAVLDLYRRQAHRITSRLLHGLSFLGIPFAIRTAGPDFVTGMGLDRLQEHWEYSYSPATEAALVEASVYGVTLPLAVSNRFAAQLDRMQVEGQGHDARATTAMVVRACVLGLHDHLSRVLSVLRLAIGEDASFEGVVAAISQLGLLWKSREPLEARNLNEVPVLLLAGYERAVYLGHGLRGTAGNAEATVTALAQLRELLVSQAGRTLEAQLYWSLLAELQRNHDAAQVRGAAAGLRYSAGLLEDVDLAIALDGHFRGTGSTTDAVAFLCGLLVTAREAAWQQPELLRVLDELLRQWPQDDFVSNLPGLRLAFAGMTPKETDRIAVSVTELHGVESLGSLVQRELNADQVQYHLAISATVAQTMGADGLADWVKT